MIKNISLLICVALYSITSHGQAIEGYFSTYSAAPGDTVDLHTSTSSSTYEFNIYRYGSTDVNVYGVTNQTGQVNEVPQQDAWKLGAQWPVSDSIFIPDSWQPGLYQLHLSDGVTEANLYLPVRAKIPGTTSKILYLDNMPNLQAHNNWGGKSLYNFNSTNNERAQILAMNRPIIGDWRDRTVHAIKFAKWADHAGIPVEYASLMDLETEPSLLSNYNLIVTAGHTEYWSGNMRDQFDTFIQNGGNAMILAGNTMWWQVRMEGDQMVCYKAAADDPLKGIDDAHVTTNWYLYPVKDPENRSIGVSWRNGGYVNVGSTYPESEGYGGYTVTDSSHWLFDGTGLLDGDYFGQADTIVGWETDGTLFNWVDGKPVVTGADGTPLNFQILGYSPAARTSAEGYATMGIFDIPGGGGTVFNAATIEWAEGLWSFSLNTISDLTVSQITYNAIAQLSGLALPDGDGDTITDTQDNCPNTANAIQDDFDKDGFGDVCDADDDNDDLSDVDEALYGTNPLLADTDGDGFSDGWEISFGSNPLSDVSFPPPDGDLAPLGKPDGNINAGDVLIAVRISLGTLTPTTKELAHGDMNADSVINLSDIIVITKKALGQ